MKKLISGLCAIFALGSVVFAGTETYSTESKSASPPVPPQWYADSEINVSVWGAYSFTSNEWREDTYLKSDHAWGGGGDLKYFFHRYFGVGLQGYLLFPRSTETFSDGVSVFTGEDERRTVGALLGTFTLRVPIGNSRIAPYVWVGGGGIFGGGQGRELLFSVDPPFTVVDHKFPQSQTKAVGQVGGGFEIRLTPRIGLLNDFSWNVVSGSGNNFGMARSGINIVF